MADSAYASQGEWGLYLRSIADRPGWSVTRLAHDAKVNRSTIHEWIRGAKADKITIGSIMAVAKAAGDDPVIGLRAAAGLLDRPGGEPAIALILDSNLPERIKRELLEHVAETRLRDEQRRLDEVRRMIRLANGGAEGKTA